MCCNSMCGMPINRLCLSDVNVESDCCCGCMPLSYRRRLGIGMDRCDCGCMPATYGCCMPATYGCCMPATYGRCMPATYGRCMPATYGRCMPATYGRCMPATYGCNMPATYGCNMPATYGCHMPATYGCNMPATSCGCGCMPINNCMQVNDCMPMCDCYGNTMKIMEEDSLCCGMVERNINVDVNINNGGGLIPEIATDFLKNLILH